MCTWEVHSHPRKAWRETRREEGSMGVAPGGRLAAQGPFASVGGRDLHKWSGCGMRKFPLAL